MRREPHGDPGAGGAEVGGPDSQPRLARESKLPCPPPAGCGFRLVVVDCERGASPPFTLSPRSGGQRTEFAAISFRSFSAASPPAFTTHTSGNADLRPVLPVGAGTAARSAAKGVYHAAVRMTLNAGVPAERRPLRTRGPSLPPACGGLCRPEVGPVLPVGAPLPARHSAWWRGAETCTIQGTALSCPAGYAGEPIMWVSPAGAGTARLRRAARVPRTEKRRGEAFALSPGGA